LFRSSSESTGRLTVFFLTPSSSEGLCAAEDEAPWQNTIHLALSGWIVSRFRVRLICWIFYSMARILTFRSLSIRRSGLASTISRLRQRERSGRIARSTFSSNAPLSAGIVFQWILTILVCPRPQLGTGLLAILPAILRFGIAGANLHCCRLLFQRRDGRLALLRSSVSRLSRGTTMVSWKRIR